MSLAPSRLSDVENSAYFKEVCQDNFEVLAEEIAKRVATYQNGSPTTIIGPPTNGTRVLNEFWRDALGGEWRCTGAGTPGTWIQIGPAAVTADPSSGTILNAELVAALGSESNFILKAYNQRGQFRSLACAQLTVTKV